MKTTPVSDILIYRIIAVIIGNSTTRLFNKPWLVVLPTWVTVSLHVIWSPNSAATRSCGFLPTLPDIPASLSMSFNHRCLANILTQVATTMCKHGHIFCTLNIAEVSRIRMSILSKSGSSVHILPTMTLSNPSFSVFCATARATHQSLCPFLA